MIWQTEDFVLLLLKKGFVFHYYPVVLRSPFKALLCSLHGIYITYCYCYIHCNRLFLHNSISSQHDIIHFLTE